MMISDEYAYSDLKSNEQSYKWCHRYCYGVLNGNIVANKWIKLAAERHFNDIERSKTEDFKYKFSPARAQHAIDFYKLTTHTKGALAGQPIQLQPWQIFIVSSIFGWITKDKDTETGKRLRRFKKAEVFVGRKNGKSTLASGIALYMMLLDGEQGAEIVTAAASKDQARIVFNDAAQMVRSGALSEIAQPYKYDIRCEDTNSIFKAVASEAKNLDGKNPHCAIIDELHSHKNSDVLDVISSGTGARKQPLIFIISTAGTILDGVAVDQWKYGEGILNNVFEDDHYFAALYSIDAGDDFSKSDVWIKANPCLGISVSYEYLENELKQALAINSAKANFLTKFMNIFVNSSTSWLDIGKVKACQHKLDLDDYKGKKCYIGLDLAQKIDLTDICLVFPNDIGGIDIFNRSFIPQGAINKATKHQQHLYRKFEQEGSLIVTNGEVTDFTIIEEFIIKFCQDFDVQHVCYDAHAAAQLAISLTKQNILMLEVSQSMMSLSEPAKEFEKMIVAKELRHTGNGVFMWCCSNSYVYTDANENIKVQKENKNSSNKIDSVISCITALSAVVYEEPNEQFVYENKPMLILGS